MAIKLLLVSIVSLFAVVAVLDGITPHSAQALESEIKQPASIETEQPTKEEEQSPPRLPAPDGAKPMAPNQLVWVDKAKGVVIVDGYVSLREGMLEMFACPRGTKEHESIVAVEASARVVHAALLAVGAKTGAPVRWNPEFAPPTGTEVGITVHWLYTDGEWQTLSAQQWIKNARTGEKMTHPWVFAGSGFWKDPATNEEFYMGDSGDFICVSNFSSATLDIPTESSQVNDGLLFEANKPMIPPLGTPVRLVLKPKLEKKALQQSKP